MNLKKLQALVGGKLLGDNVTFQGASIDTRTLVPKQIFIAIEGATQDGHAFIPSALEAGASAVLASKSECIPPGASALIIEDVVLALGKWAKAHRQSFQVPCIGVTGSCGKTSVRSMIAHIGSLTKKTLSPERNFNNHIGLPLTVLKLSKETQLAVFELGASGPNEIAYLADIAKPSISTITNVYPAHLEGFKSLEGVVAAKGEIYQALSPEGVAVLNLDSPYTKVWLSSLSSHQKITYSVQQKADVYALDIQLSSIGSQFELVTPQGQVSIRLSVPGLHQVENAICAAACLYPLEISLATIKRGLETFEGVAGRMNKTTLNDGTTVIDDTYNANPGSMQAAIGYLKSCPKEQILVIGDMGELGIDAKFWHEKLGNTAKEQGIDQVIATGPLSRFTVEAFGKRGQWFESKEAMLQALEQSKPGATILMKGSRSARMEEVVNAFIQRRGKQA